REIRRILAQERRQRLLEVARRDAPQVEHRQKCVQGLRAPCPQRQDRRSEANPVAIAGRSAISNLHPGDLDSADPRLDRSRRAVAVPHEAVAAVGKLQAIHRGKKRLGFHLDSLRKQLPCTRSQDIRQWIVDLVGLTQWDNVAILVHGVSLSLRGSGRLDTRLDTPPISFRHHPVSRIARWPRGRTSGRATGRSLSGIPYRRPSASSPGPASSARFLSGASRPTSLRSRASPRARPASLEHGRARSATRMSGLRPKGLSSQCLRQSAPDGCPRFHCYTTIPTQRTNTISPPNPTR